MAITNSIRTATLRFNGGSLKLQANFENLEKLKTKTGKSPFDFIFAIMDYAEPDEMIETVRTLLFCLQADAQEYSEGEIHDWLFGSFTGFFNEETLTHLNEVLGAVIGEDLKAKAPEVEEKPDAPKK